MKPTKDEVLALAREADDELIMAGMVGTRDQYAQTLATLAYAAGAAAMKERAAKVCEDWDSDAADPRDVADAIRALGDDDGYN